MSISSLQKSCFKVHLRSVEKGSLFCIDDVDVIYVKLKYNRRTGKYIVYRYDNNHLHFEFDGCILVHLVYKLIF